VEYKLLIIRYGEIALKSKETRNRFENTLINNIKKAFNKREISNIITKEWGRIYVQSEQIDKCIDVLKRIFGITSISQSIQTKSDIDSIYATSKFFSDGILNNKKSFGLRVTRTGNHKFTSQEVAIKVGNYIRNSTGAKVNLNNPDLEIFIDIRGENSYIFTEKIRGMGGMPMGTQGNVLAIVSNTKSILSAWFVLRRGCKVFYADCNGRYKEKLNSFISEWYTNSDIIFLNSNSNNFYHNLYDTVVEKNCDAIVVGNSLFGKNYKELKEIQCLKEKTGIPILHPLIFMGDNEIKEKCVEIGI